ncbi:ABC transporter ATP-binding protein [Alkalihalobacillus trypoxylicola]|uniref:ABC transporter n=1 Tax=Alkalihalobacillus trypoxylicola TaxID=519424 RepID=A0A161QC72_9BACI|nr:ABC transporter ATP-binding protein [Alkalihalobacillus trypoxylicola]KYG25542.1 ABC transporter [Alkalihalobacillus trypoxylicola]
MIRTEQLTKKYGSFTALDELTLTIEEGTVFGFVGQNGAGKSTTFQILATLMSPTYGTAYIDGIDVCKEPAKVREKIGYMPDFFGVYDQFRAVEYLDFYGASYGLTVDERKKIIPQLLDLVNLSHKSDSYVDLLSRGMKQRLCLARSLIHDPSVLILDEPASGLDPRARIEMRGILRELKAMGKTIIISSHILPELAEMCDEIGVIDQGKLVAKGSVTDIQKQLEQQKLIQVKVQKNIDQTMMFFEDQSHVINLNQLNETDFEFIFTGDDASQIQLLQQAIAANIPLLSFHLVETNIEDVFMEITKGVEEE